MTSESLSREEAEQRFLANKQPGGRFITAEDVAGMMLFLCGPESRDISGAALPIDGGWSISLSTAAPFPPNSRAGPRASLSKICPRMSSQSTKLRVLDVIGLALAGAETDFGRSVRDAALAISPPGPCRILGFGDRVGVTTAAFANGAFSQALEFDDTHNESIVHMSSPAVAAALALAEFHAGLGARSDHRHRDRQRGLLPCGQRFLRRTASAWISSHRIVCDFRSGVSGRQTARARSRSISARRGHRWELRIGTAGMLGGWNADQVSPSWMVGAKRHHRGVAGAIGRYGSRAGV